jgi:thymidylate synthase (FAD)
VARELARIDLPLSTYTQWYWKIDLTTCCTS